MIGHDELIREAHQMVRDLPVRSEDLGLDPVREMLSVLADALEAAEKGRDEARIERDAALDDVDAVLGLKAGGQAAVASRCVCYRHLDDPEPPGVEHEGAGA